MADNNSSKSIVIQALGLEKQFRSGTGWLDVLKGVSVDIERGSIVAIVGPSGAGKSTLLHLLGGLDRPTKGKVLLEGEEIVNYSDIDLAKTRNQKIGFLFQFHHLLPEFTAVENIGLPRRMMGESKEKADKRAKELLEQLGLAGRGHHRPGELSGGEQQRVALARALVNNPAVVLADEPTGNLDRQTGNQVLDIVWDLQKNNSQTFIIVTHDESIAERATRRIRIIEGRIVEDSKN
jgi:lipoprotein-releasing system ATP-binding protein